MPVMIQITGENAGQAIEEFAALSTAFTGAVNATVAPVVEEKQKRQRATKPETKPETTKEIEKVEETKNETSNEASGDEIPTVVELRAAGQEKGKTPEGKKAIKALLDEFESKSLSEVPEEKRAEFLERLKAL
jgi:hypothetical protein